MYVVKIVPEVIRGGKRADTVELRFWQNSPLLTKISVQRNLGLFGQPSVHICGVNL